MKVAIIADIHDNAHNLVLAMEKINTLGVEKIIFLGDFILMFFKNLLSSIYFIIPKFFSIHLHIHK